MRREAKERVVRVLSVAVAAVTATLVATDWPGDVAGAFWSRHPMCAGVTSGMVMLAIGYLLVDGWLTRANARKWEVVRGIAFKALGKAADDLGSGMDRVYDRALDAASDRPRDKQWCRTAVLQLDELKHSHREQIARWAPVLMATPELSAVLNACAQLNEEVFALQSPLRAIRDLPANASPTSEQLTAVRDAWATTRMRCVLNQEQLMRAAVDQRWQHHGARRRLPPPLCDQLDTAHELEPLPVPRAARRPDVSADVATGLI